MIGPTRLFVLFLQNQDSRVLLLQFLLQIFHHLRRFQGSLVLLLQKHHALLPVPLDQGIFQVHSFNFPRLHKLRGHAPLTLSKRGFENWPASMLDEEAYLVLAAVLSWSEEMNLLSARLLLAWKSLLIGLSRWSGCSFSSCRTPESAASRCWRGRRPNQRDSHLKPFHSHSRSV